MQKFRKFAWISIGIGVLFLLIGLSLWQKTRRFVASAATAQGVVIEMIEVRDNDGSNMFKPVVRFTTLEDEQVTFTSSMSSRPPAYQVGESVVVLYSPRDVNDARIKGFWSLWLGPIVLGSLGAAFTAIGVSIRYAGRVSAKKRDYLMAYGNVIETDVQGVDRNTDYAVNGQNPWRISSQWLDPATRKLRVFHSENLWFDPSKFLNGKQVTVLLDPDDPKKYVMDVSFLPEMDEGK